MMILIPDHETPNHVKCDAVVESSNIFRYHTVILSSYCHHRLDQWILMTIFRFWWHPCCKNCSPHRSHDAEMHRLRCMTALHCLVLASSHISLVRTNCQLPTRNISSHSLYRCLSHTAQIHNGKGHVGTELRPLRHTHRIDVLLRHTTAAAMLQLLESEESESEESEKCTSAVISRSSMSGWRSSWLEDGASAFALVTLLEMMNMSPCFSRVGNRYPAIGRLPGFCWRLTMA